jgi:hypothetical protein
MLGQTCFFRLKTTGEIVCAFALSADSIRTHLLPGSRRKKNQGFDAARKSNVILPCINKTYLLTANYEKD